MNSSYNFLTLMVYSQYFDPESIFLSAYIAMLCMHALVRETCNVTACMHCKNKEVGYDPHKVTSVAALVYTRK